MTSETTKEQPWPLRVGAELVGAFLICFAVYVLSTFGSIIFQLNLAYVALGTGLAYAAAALALGGVSGGHFNPAVTVAAMIAGRTKVVDGILYIVFQVIGASLAGLLVKVLLPTSENVTIKQWLTTTVNGFDKGSVAYSTLTQYGLSFSVTQAIAVELVAGLIIVGVAMATYGTKRYAAATGAAYAIGAAITFPVTGAALNPARATGIALFAQGQGLEVEPLTQLWVFWICPVLAAALVSLAMLLQQMAVAPKAKGDDPAQLTEYNEAAGSGKEPTAGAGDAQGESSQDDVHAEVGGQQSDAEADADEGVERD
ncbi:MIP/aquaporin family protein [Bifidobacterium platyrrhinorum]|uniref:Glycerol transporter n=1 Tax=Bifidobacterium platyrrhinorum TaxID=2661628 RepID=A0A6L9SQI6_9BIFI|nr:aquaporin [Bifidobacterium platyrrhinorum]NEG54780.1 glycerol transporter [Bifidobacterium platyrrhinorum]